MLVMDSHQVTTFPIRIFATLFHAGIRRAKLLNFCTPWLGGKKSELSWRKLIYIMYKNCRNLYFGYIYLFRPTVKLCLYECTYLYIHKHVSMYMCICIRYKAREICRQIYCLEGLFEPMVSACKGYENQGAIVVWTGPTHLGHQVLSVHKISKIAFRHI